MKFYSSGMFVRLGFAVAVAADPRVLLVDEVLAVGDLAFQIKCFDRMMQMRDGGATVVVVSHNLNAVRRMCDRTIVMHDGEVRYDGDTAARSRSTTSSWASRATSTTKSMTPRRWPDRHRRAA